MNVVELKKYNISLKILFKYLSKCSKLSSTTAGGARVYPPFTYTQVSHEFKAHGEVFFL